MWQEKVWGVDLGEIGDYLLLLSPGKGGIFSCWARMLNVGGAGQSRAVLTPEMHPVWLV